MIYQIRDLIKEYDDSVDSDFTVVYQEDGVLKCCPGADDIFIVEKLKRLNKNDNFFVFDNKRGRFVFYTVDWWLDALQWIQHQNVLSLEEKIERLEQKLKDLKKKSQLGIAIDKLKKNNNIKEGV